jgi:oligopeptide transport system substrate-binding protein
MNTLFTRNVFLSITCFLIFLISCDLTKSYKEDRRENGNTLQGGTITFIRSQFNITTLPMAANDEESSFIITQIYDRLFKIKSNSNQAIPYLVDKYVITNDGKTYTFELKKGVFFQDDDCYQKGKGKELTSKDVKFTIELICTKNENNFNFDYTLRNLIVGANEFYANSDKKFEQELSGLKIIDKYKFSIDIENSTSKLLQILSSHALSIISKEAYLKYGRNLANGTGAFRIAKSSSKSKTVLIRNANYFYKDSLGNRLPYIDTAIVLRNDNINERLRLFKIGKADIVTTIPAKDIKHIIEDDIQFFENTNEKAKFIVDFDPEFSTRVLLLNLNRKPFDNKLIRKAINYGIDKEKILEVTGTGLSAGAAYASFVPPVMSIMGYTLPENANYKFNLALAKKYLNEAGYPNGKNLPALHLIIPQHDDAIKMALEIQKQLLQHLNIKLEFEIMDLNKNIELVINQGNYQMSNFYWIADYPSPESFLNLFYYDEAQKTSNYANYNNPNYNHYFEKAIKSNNVDSMMHYFNSAETILMDDAPMVFLYYGSNFRLMNNRVLHLENPLLRNYDLSKVMIRQK